MNARIALMVGMALLAGCSKTVILTVTVRDAPATALSGANVTVSPQGNTPVTDALGQAVLSYVDLGPTVVIAEKPGYQTKAMAVGATAGITSSVTIQLSPAAKTTVAVYQGNPTTNPYTVTVPEATLSGKVVVQVYELWTTGEWLELPISQVIYGTIVYEDRATVGEGFVKLGTYTPDFATLYGGKALLGATYKIVVTIPPSAAPRKTAVEAREDHGGL